VSDGRVSGGGQLPTVQGLGHLVASFVAASTMALVEFGVPLTDAQQNAILKLVVTGWALFSGVWAVVDVRRNWPVEGAARSRAGVAGDGGPVGAERQRCVQ